MPHYSRKPKIQSIELKPRSAQFATLEITNMELVSEIIDNVGSLLNWRPRSVSIAHEILRRMGGENVTLQFTMATFGSAIRPDLEGQAQSRYMARYIKMLRDDMDASGFRAVNIEIGQKYQLPNGTWMCHKTKYTQGDFEKLYRYCQDEVIKSNFADWELGPRRKKLREIVLNWLSEQGCKPVPPIVRKPNGMAEPNSNVVDIGERITLRDVEKRIGDAFEALSAAGIDWLKLGKSLPDYVRKMESLKIDVEIRLQAARKVQVVRQKNGRVKLNGVQPK